MPPRLFFVYQLIFETFGKYVFHVIPRSNVTMNLIYYQYVVIFLTAVEMTGMVFLKVSLYKK